jgi:Peptidase M15
VDHPAQHKGIGARLWIATIFVAALVGPLMVDLPASHAADATSPALEAASVGGQETGSAGKEASETIRWEASSFCLDGTLREVINQVAAIFGPIRVNSTCRSRARNAKIGGAPRSKHLNGQAADFSVSPNNKPAVLAFLQKNASVGGLKLYSGSKGHFHIDTGPRRTW